MHIIVQSLDKRENWPNRERNAMLGDATKDDRGEENDGKITHGSERDGERGACIRKGIRNKRHKE